MSRKIKYLLYIVFIILCFALIDSDLEVAASNVKYVEMDNDRDVYFSNISTSSGSEVSVSTDRRSIDFGTISLNNIGDREIVTYELSNDKSFNDVSVDLLINGLKEYENDFLTIKCDDFGLLEKGMRKSGTITIELKKTVVEEIDFPLNFSMKINPIHKRFKLFN